jgi:hypothetical protein
MPIQEKYNDSTPNRPWGERPLDAAMIVIDIPAFVQQIKSEEAWLKNDRNAITVFKTDHLRKVIVALHKDAIMAKPLAEGVMTIQIFEGRIRCHSEDQTIDVFKHQILTIHEGMPYEIKAIEETSFLLTMTATKVSMKA